MKYSQIYDLYVKKFSYNKNHFYDFIKEINCVCTKKSIFGMYCEILAINCFNNYKKPSWLIGIKKSNLFYDKIGIDIFVETDAGHIGIQIKSNTKLAKNLNKKHPNILVAVINPKSSNEFICKRLLKIINKKYFIMKKSLKRKWYNEKEVDCISQNW